MHYVCTRSHVLVCTKQKWPGGGGGGESLKAKFLRPVSKWRCGVLHLTIEHELSNREGESRGEGSEGIRLRDKAAGAGCPAGSRSYCALVLPQTQNTSIQPSFALLFVRVSKRITGNLFLLLGWTHNLGLLLCYYTFFFFLCICHGTAVGMVVYLKSFHSLLSVFKRKGEF